MNVKTTYLNSELEEKIYMKQFKSFVMRDNKNKVCKLLK